MKRFLQFGILFIGIASLPVFSLSGITGLGSVSSDGTQGNSDSTFTTVVISGNGRHVGFESYASNLVPLDDNNMPDLFVHDRAGGETTMLPQGNYTYDQLMALSYDGRYVAFRSPSSDLVPDDNNGKADIFFFDRLTGEIRRVSVSSEGEEANDHSYSPSISADGRYISFLTFASNLVAGIDSSTLILIHDQQTGMTTVGSINYLGQPIKASSGKISSDARFVLFTTSLSSAVPGDTNNAYDVFVYDRWLGTTERASVSTVGEEGNDHSYGVDISANGQYVLFTSWATNLVLDGTYGRQMFIHDRSTGETKLVSRNDAGEQANSNLFFGAISGTGRYVSFSTTADNLVANDANSRSDVFIRDLLSEKTRLVSVGLSGGVGNGTSARPSMSQDGRIVAFWSSSTDLVEEDLNGFDDIFAREMWFPTLSSNYPDGAPGSTFALTGARSLVTTTITVTVNSVPLGVVPVAPDGTFAFQLDTAQADPGRYTIAMHAPFADEVAIIWLDPAAPVRPPEGSGPLFDIPAGIAERLLYLPAVRQ